MGDKRLSYLILGGLVVGMGAGLGIRAWGLEAGPILAMAKFVGELFLRGLFMLILPLVIPMIISGIQKLSETESLGRIGARAALAILGLTGIAAGVGLLMVLWLRPGAALSPEKLGHLGPLELSLPSRSFTDMLLSLLPKNPLHEMATAFTPAQEGGLIAVVSFSILLGIALTRIPEATAAPLYGLLEALFQASQWLLWKVLWWLAPIGVAGLTLSATLSLGWQILPLLGGYVVTVVLGLAIQMLVVYALFVRLLARRNPMKVLQLSGPALLMAFSSASSNATLPMTLRVATERLGVSPPIARFITTLGATVNQNGTALYEGVTLIFLMQVFGKAPGISEGALVVLMAMLIAIGAAGVPGGSLPLLAGLLPTFGIPSTAIALIYGVDRLLDMLRTTLNVYGDLVIATYLQRLYASPHDPRRPA